MMLWDIIRDWFVQNIFGGCDSNQDFFETHLGNGYYVLSGTSNYESYPTGDYWGYAMPGFSDIDMYNDGSVYLMSIGDWLSTTATIIVLCVGCFLAFAFIAWLFKKVGGAITRIGQ